LLAFARQAVHEAKLGRLANAVGGHIGTLEGLETIPWTLRTMRPYRWRFMIGQTARLSQKWASILMRRSLSHQTGGVHEHIEPTTSCHNVVDQCFAG